METASKTAEMSMMPTFEEWRNKVQELDQERDAAERENKDIEAAKDAEVAHWQKTARDVEAEREIALQRKHQVHAETLHKVHQARWTVVQQATEYEDRLRALETYLENERRAQMEELDRQNQMLARTRDAAEARIREADQRHNAAVDAAEIQAKEAEALAQSKVKRAEQEVARAREREEVRVADVKKIADARVRECEDQKQFDLEEMHGRCIQRQRAMEESLYASGRQTSEVLSETRRHAAVFQQGMKELRASEEIALAHKESRLDEWTAVQRAQNSSTTNHSKGLLDLEKSLHKRTVERTLGRVVTHLKMEDTDGRSGGSNYFAAVGNGLLTYS